MNKKEWDKLPADLKMILEVSVRDFAYDMVSRLDADNAIAVVEASADPSITIVDWSEEERAKFRAIDRGQWEKWAGRNALTKKVYDTATDYMKTAGLLK